MNTTTKNNRFILFIISFLITLLLFINVAHSKTMEDGEFYKHKLKNGLDVIVVENHTVPLATIVISAKNGAYTETPEYNGLSHFYEHMFFKGNKAIPTQEKYMSKIRELGIIYNGYTTREAVVYYFTLPIYNLDEGLKFMNDAIRTPLFDETEIKKEKTVILGEYDRNESSPRFHLDRALSQKLFWKNFSRVDTIGDRDVIKNATKEQFETIQKKYYVPNNCAFFVVGDVDHNEIFKKVEAIYSDWESGENPFIKNPIPEHPLLTKTEKIIVNYPAKTPMLSTYWKGPDIPKDEKATYALDVFFTALDLPSSKFQKSLVESGLASSCSMSYYTQSTSGQIFMSSSLAADKVNEFRKSFEQELIKMKDSNYITDEEIESAKKSIEIDYLYRKENSQEYATGALAFFWAVSGFDYYQNYVENSNKITKEDIKEALDKYFFDKNYVMGILVSKEDQQKYNIAF